MAQTFLTAEWRKLIMANYAIDPARLEKYVPAKTELDFCEGNCYVSLVGFMFLNTKLKGVAIPFHQNFEEVNLRFYVRYKEDSTGWKRGVVFVKEIVPKPAITFVANLLYNEKYETMKMDHKWSQSGDILTAEYYWKKKEWNKLAVLASSKSEEIRNGSIEEFITEHYWGYTQINKEKTSEYQVMHPRWNVYRVNSYNIEVDFHDIYGRDFEFLSGEKPLSVILAEGSEIQVKHGLKI